MDKLNLFAALPEILLLIGICLVILIDVLRKSPQPAVGVDRLALLALVPPFIATLMQAGGPKVHAFDGMYVVDALGNLLKACSYVAIAASIIYARNYAKDRGMFRGEFYGLLLFSLLGQMVMISAGNLLVMYLGLEVMSLSLYALAALRRDDPDSAESAIKYFVLGALASGFLLYGMSMIYGGTGTLDLAQIAQRFSAGQVNQVVFVFGVVFIVAGVAFKFGAVPFHMWVPDVYAGSPTATTLLIAGAPKLATFAMAFRLLADSLQGAAQHWQQMFLILALLSLVLGNLAAIAQSNLKRMLAYSTISQIGFVLLGLMSGVVGGKADGAAGAYSGALFYVITYVLTTLGTFGLIQMLARAGFESDQISDLAGLNKRNPWMAAVMLILMFSLAGIPPTVGFYAKLGVLQSVIDAGYLWMAIVAVMASLVGAFYYLRIVKTMYFDEPPETVAAAQTTDARVVLAFNGLLVLGLGIVPGPLMTACLLAIRQSLGV
ncbi:MAG: NADH-quinone oxidoreductase subunit NuoN [Burkholderiaceae bacterium]